MNLRFTMGGVNVNTFGEWIYTLDKNREVTTLCTINGQTHLSTACTWDGEWALTPIFKKAVSDGVLTENDSNYFQLFTIPLMLDTIAFNAPRVVDLYDTSDIFAITKTLSTARESIYRLADFCKKYFPGFENSYISNIATHLGTRVSKRVAGKYIYTVEDLKSGKKFKNPVVVSNYPIDVHSADKNKSVLEKQYQEYCLPVESLMSKDYDNVYVIGRNLSADFYAQAALRIIPSCFSMGEGLAKYICQNSHSV